MTRNLKILGTALVASLALSAVSASSASAEAAELSVGIEPTIDGEQIGADTFTIGTVPVTCATVTFHGNASTLESGSPEMALTLSYETCHAMMTIAGLKSQERRQ